MSTTGGNLNPIDDQHLIGRHVTNEAAPEANGILNAAGILPIYLCDDVNEINDANLAKPINLVKNSVEAIPVSVPNVPEALKILALKDGVNLKRNGIGAYDFVAPAVNGIQHIAEENVRKIYRGLTDYVVTQIMHAEYEAYRWIDNNPDLVAGALVNSSLLLFPGFVTGPLLATGGLNEESRDADVIGNVAIGKLLADLKSIGAGGAGMAILEAIAATATAMIKNGTHDIVSGLASIKSEYESKIEDPRWQADTFTYAAISQEEGSWGGEDPKNFSQTAAEGQARTNEKAWVDNEVSNLEWD